MTYSQGRSPAVALCGLQERTHALSDREAGARAPAAWPARTDRADG